ncbi:hypothetical protein GCM10007424_01660 [Flavobacterium suaedae]|uniref:Uncharacterized protein n=1 Tax=Flavobacterium suaedae TaxID=1767027 RepID=A0ABQ1JCZ1_9FLAO|nr:hypothetical protein GCM10007424_01660 [Flavobacterium suaedae]
MISKLLNRITLKAIFPTILLCTGLILTEFCKMFKYTEYHDYMAYGIVLGYLTLLFSIVFSFVCSLEVYREMKVNFKRYYILLLLLALLPLFLFIFLMILFALY